MSDNLRDRIANAAGDFLSDNFHAYLEQDVALELADAVIQELGLRLQHRSGLRFDSEGCSHTDWMHRYVTEWVIDGGPTT